MTDVFRLALLNPNTDARHTEAMAGDHRETLPAGCEVTAVSPERGPTSIESEADAWLPQRRWRRSSASCPPTTRISLRASATRVWVPHAS